MTAPLYRAAGPVTLIGGGPVDADRLAEALRLAPEAVAADGGGDIALPQGRSLAAVIGDMDSLRSAEALRRRGVPLHPIAEQDSTDLEKCLYSVEAPLFLGVGFLGGRIDHALAALGVLARGPDGRLILVGAEDLCLLCPPEFEFEAPAGTRVSLFAMRPVTGRVSEGLRWPIVGLDFAPDGRNGVSNEATGGRVRIGFDAPGAILILPAGMLGQVFRRLAPA